MNIDSIRVRFRRRSELVFYYVVIVFSLLILCLAGYGLVQMAQPVHAAPAAKQLEVGCEVVGTVGTVIIGHCIDQNGNEFEANSAGFMVPVGN